MLLFLGGKHVTEVQPLQMMSFFPRFLGRFLFTTG